MYDRALCWKLSEYIKEAFYISMRSGKAQEIVGESSLGGNTYYIDKVTEDVVIDYLKNNGINCTLISEESGKISFGDDFLMFLDPIDGSNNAISNLPFFCTSLGIYRKDSKFGLVRNLVWEEWFEGLSNYGCLVNGKPLIYNPISKMVSVYTKKGKYIEELRTITNKLRCFGSVALEICYVAQGSLMAFVDVRNKMRTTDIAAAKVILESAGGQITDLNGDDLSMDEEHINIIATSNKELHKKIINILR